MRPNFWAHRLATGPSDAAALKAAQGTDSSRAGVVDRPGCQSSPPARAPDGMQNQRPNFRRVRRGGFPLRFSAFPSFLPLTAPTLGLHNREVLDSYLGYSPERIASLEQGGVLHSGKC